MTKTAWPNSLSEALEILKPMMSDAFGQTAETHRRVWWARDEVARLRRQLNDAETVLTAAERDYEQTGKQMLLVWEDLRGEVLKIPTANA